MMEKIKADPSALPASPGIEKALTESFPELMVVLKKHAEVSLEAITRDNTGKRLAFVLDGKMLMAPKIYEPIRSGEFKIAGLLSEEEAKKIASRLNELSKCK
jgi:preprotein translocase subunit SecD